MLRNALYVTTALLLLGCAQEANETPPATPAESGAESVTQGEEPATESRLVFHTSPLAELYFRVRGLAADAEAQIPAGYEAAVEAARGVQAELGSFGGWGSLDTRMFAADDAAEMREYFESVQEPTEHRGREVSIRENALRMADALLVLEPTFLQESWPQRQAELEERIAELEERFLPRHVEALAYMMESLGIDDPKVEVPVVLVGESNPPGAMTYFMRGGKPLCLVDVLGSADGDQLIELLLHETSHTLDIASRSKEDAFEVLRNGLAAKGVERRTYLYDMVPHLVMFVQAEETTRRFYSPEHVAYGDTYGVYERAGGLAVLERREWVRYLNGEISRQEALENILAAIDPDLPKDS